MSGVTLGQSATYPDQYDAKLLEPIPRQLSRSQQHLSVPMFGWDLWNAYELSWLNPSGVPRVAIAEFTFSAGSSNIVESKSFKYYLNSFNQTVFESDADVVSTLEKDLADISGGGVNVLLYSPSSGEPAITQLPGFCIDQTTCTVSEYQPNATLLYVDTDEPQQDKTRIFSHLLKSNCPVTGQPDWASIWLEYTGAKLDEASFLKYVVSFRQYQGFHESCVERVFADLMSLGTMSDLTVYARYTRRGGLDINPIRSTRNISVNEIPFRRNLRQ